jgi:molecular chaperone GrpE
MVKKQKTLELEGLKTRIEELENNYKRALADYQNQERRHRELSSSMVKMASASLIEKMLLNLDALQMAQQHLKDKGLQMVIDQFLATFAGEGLRPIETNGSDFDPLTMDCIEVVPGEKEKVV